jgi:integrase
MRISEIGQLLLLDIFEHHGIPHFNVTNTYSRRLCEMIGVNYQLTSNIKKKIKRKASRRFIPVHSELIKSGFLEHVDQQKLKVGSHPTDKLFPDWNPDYKDSYSGTFKYGRTLEVLGIKEKGCTHFAFHSFRHCFMDALRNADVAQNTADKLFGHAQNKVSGEYGSDYITAEQSAKIEMVKYNGLDLSHLYPFKY